MLKYIYYRYKIILSNKIIVFWSIIFPLILASFFNIAFSDIGKEENFKTIKVAIINDENSLSKSMEEIKFGKKKAFSIKELDENKANNALSEGKIKAIIYGGDNIKLKVKETSIETTIVKLFLNTKIQIEETIVNGIKKNPEIQGETWFREFNFGFNNIKEIPINSGINNPMIIAFYSVIGMGIMYGSFFGSYALTTMRGNISEAGKRMELSPTSKSKMLITDFLIGVSLVFTGSLILLAFYSKVLDIKLSNYTGIMIGINFLGSMLAVSFGYLVALITRKKENLSISISIFITMTMSFLAGMMSINIKFAVERAIPFIRYINPIALITDSYYRLYYFDSVSVIKTNLIALGVMIIVILGLNLIFLRREGYDTI